MRSTIKDRTLAHRMRTVIRQVVGAIEIITVPLAFVPGPVSDQSGKTSLCDLPAWSTFVIKLIDRLGQVHCLLRYASLWGMVLRDCLRSDSCCLAILRFFTEDLVGRVGFLFRGAEATALSIMRTFSRQSPTFRPWSR